MRKRLTHATWQNVCISNYLSAGKNICLTADRLLCLSAYLTGCLLSTRSICFGILYLLALQPCFSVFFFSVLCLSAYISTFLPTSLFGCVSSQSLRLTPDNATRAGNRGLQQSCVKVIETWLTGQAAYLFDRINVAEPQWQLLPTHLYSFAKKPLWDTLDCIHMSVYCIPLEKAKNKTQRVWSECSNSLQYWTTNILSYPSEHAVKLTMSHFVINVSNRLFWCQMAVINTPNKTYWVCLMLVDSLQQFGDELATIHNRTPSIKYYCNG